MSRPRISDEHGFSVELNSKEHLRRFTILSGAGNSILVEGSLGEFQQITFVEGLMLEVKCSNGVLRIEMKEDELNRAFATKAPSKEGYARFGGGLE